MKMLKKLALVSAVSMISAGAFAMEVMDEETMSAVTGQDGITIKVSLGDRTEAELNALGVTTGTFDQIDLKGPTGGATTADILAKGLSIGQVTIHDDDGLADASVTATATVAGTANSGALVIGGGSAADNLLTGAALVAAKAADSTVVFTDNNAEDPIVIEMDMVGDSNGTTAGGGAMLNVNIHTPKLAIKLGNVYVANSNAAAIGLNPDGTTNATAAVDTDGTDIDNATKIKILNSMEIVLGSMDIGVQLGSENQTLFGGTESATNPNVMVKIDATLVGGLAINNLQLDDQFQSPSATAGSTGGGSFFASSLKVLNAGSTTTLNALAGINIASDIDGAGADTAGGLVVTLGGLGGKGTDAVFGTADDTGADVTINDIRLGSATALDLGDVQMLGLNMNGTSLIISGH